MSYDRQTEKAVKAIGSDEVDGIPVRAGQHRREGLYELIGLEDHGAQWHWAADYEVDEETWLKYGYVTRKYETEAA